MLALTHLTLVLVLAQSVSSNTLNSSVSVSSSVLALTHTELTYLRNSSVGNVEIELESILSVLTHRTSVNSAPA